LHQAECPLDASLTGRCQGIQIIAAEADSLGAYRERLQDVTSTLDAAIHENIEPVTHGIDNLGEFEGSSVHYWATPVEGRLCKDQEVAIIGAGNSAGQAVVYLASQCKKVWLILRGYSLHASMSRYLIERIAALPNVEILAQTEVTALEGKGGTLDAIRWQNRPTGEESRHLIRHLFLFIGAEPNAGWLRGCTETDEKGFIVTGKGALSLETNVTGVFAIGDVRAGSTKRVAAAVGEGAAVVAQIHAMMSKRSTEA